MVRSWHEMTILWYEILISWYEKKKKLAKTNFVFAFFYVKKKKKLEK